ncbi:MAG TPA: hypothetical protein VNO21_14950, partial [Polyangiaceae bacterium]|nr:hypothetical protein [Polyangiaceae bacterium]
MNVAPLLRNPLTRFAIRYEDSGHAGSDAWRAIHLALPVRGRPLRRIVVDRVESPQLFEAARELLRDEHLTHAAIVNAHEELANIGLLVSPDAISDLVAFEPWFIDPDEAPAREASGEFGDWTLSPSAFCQAPGVPLPAAIADRVILESMGSWGGDETWLLPESMRIWVEDPGTQVLAPFGVPASLTPTLESLFAGELSPRRLPANVHRALRDAGVLTTSDLEVRRHADWDGLCAEAHEQFVSQGFTTLEG